MNNQLSIFSIAIPYLHDADLALAEMDFENAEDLLNTAKSIDPTMNNLDSTIKICRFLKTNFNKTSDTKKFLAKMWQKIPKAVKQNHLLPSEGKHADRILSKIAFQKLKHDSEFIDPEQALHWACCYFINEQTSEAHKLLLHTLTTNHPNRADLWGYYGDVCFQLERYREVNSAYLRALIIDPQALDMFRLNHKELSQLYFRLIQTYPDQEARALLLFNAWAEHLLEIPRNQQTSRNEIKQLREKVFQKTYEKPAKRLHQFTICLYLDQSQPSGEIDYQVRERMMELNEELFARYLEIKPRPQRF